MKVVYKAFDGSEFPTAEQCQAYEEKLKNKIVVKFTQNGLTFHYEYYDIGKAKRDIANKVKESTENVGFINYPNQNKVEVITKEGKHSLYFCNLLEFVPAHYKIKGKLLDTLFL